MEIQFPEQKKVVAPQVQQIIVQLGSDAPHLESLAYFGKSKDDFILFGDEALLTPQVITHLIQILKQKLAEVEPLDPIEECEDV